MSTHASNQFAVWIENADGEVVKTLFVTNFTAARRGYRNREDAVSSWVSAANPDAMTDAEIDAISGATPSAGTQNFAWDMTADDGSRVPDGVYKVMVEGTLFWSSSVLYAAELDTANVTAGELSVSETRSEPDNRDNENMLANVRVSVMVDTHSLIKTEAASATCETDGNIAYWSCSQCGKLFSDAEAKNEIAPEGTVVKATGHDWNEWSVTVAATEEADGMETRICNNDASHIETRTIPKLQNNPAETQQDEQTAQGCYVATAVYGSYDCPEVWTLRRFRDNVLAKTWYGRLFIRAYYAVSPAAVKLFGDSSWFQSFFRDKLDGLVSNLQAEGFESTPYQDYVW